MTSPIVLVYFAVETETKDIERGHEGVHSWTLSDKRLDENVRSGEGSHVLEVD